MATAAYDTCQWCDGEGSRDILAGQPCAHCNGVGMIDLNDFTDSEEDEDADE